jgi:protein phosphatase
MEHLVTTSVRTAQAERIGSTRTSIANSRLLLCTDGVHKLVDMSKIRSVLDQPIPPAGAASTLVTVARQLGSKDNATALVVDPAPVASASEAA